MSDLTARAEPEPDVLVLDHSPKIPALVSSRVCHDLASPIGAVGNGFELLRMQGLDDSPELELISNSLKNAVGKLRFLRVAFGHADPDQILPRGEIQDILALVSEAGKVKIDWTPLIDPPQPSVCVAFLLVMCLETSMPMGGRVTVSESRSRWKIEGRAPTLRFDNPHWGYLLKDRPIQEPSSNGVHFHLAAQQLRQQGYSLRAELSETRAVLEF